MNANVTAGGAPPRAGRREWIGLAVLALPTLLLSLDISVLNLALPHLSAALGAELAGASAPAVETAAECGWSFGIAFQILDDVNDLLADAAATGKQAGKDLLQGVHTLPVIYAAEEKPELRDALALGVSPDSLPSVLSSIRATAGLARALDQATAHADRARSEACGLPGGESLEALIEEALIAPLSRL